MWTFIGGFIAGICFGIFCAAFALGTMLENAANRPVW